MSVEEKAQKWDDLCECLRWGKNTPVETILLEFNAAKTGNRLKRAILEVLRIAVENELPQIGQNIKFRRRFYELTDFDAPDWFKEERERER